MSTEKSNQIENLCSKLRLLISSMSSWKYKTIERAKIVVEMAKCLDTIFLHLKEKETQRLRKWEFIIKSVCGNTDGVALRSVLSTIFVQLIAEFEELSSNRIDNHNDVISHQLFKLDIFLLDLSSSKSIPTIHEVGTLSYSIIFEQTKDQEIWKLLPHRIHIRVLERCDGQGVWICDYFRSKQPFPRDNGNFPEIAWMHLKRKSR